MASKDTYIVQFQDMSSRFAQVADDISAMVDVYFDRAYDTGSGSISDTNASPYGIAASDISGMVTLGQQLSNFLTSASVVVADYGATANKMRTDV
jgi:hypothetical protein